MNPNKLFLRLFICFIITLLSISPAAASNLRVVNQHDFDLSETSPSFLDADGKAIKAKVASIRKPKPTEDPHGFTTQLAAPQTEMSYYGGAILQAPKTYHIWVGSFPSSTIEALDYFTAYLGKTAWWGIQDTYPDSNGIVSETVTLSHSIKVPNTGRLHPHTMINKLISSGKLPYDSTGIYVIFFRDVVVPGFLSEWCGIHSSYVPKAAFQSRHPSGTTLKFALVGDATGPAYSIEFAENCGSLDTSINGNGIVDTMASVLAHELAEAATDPDPFILPSYLDEAGNENADKCAWEFGEYLTGISSMANIKVGDRYYRIQQNWANRYPNSGCVLEL